MSRSVRRSPYLNAYRDAPARRAAFRAWRRRVNQLTAGAEDDVRLPALLEVSNVFNFPSDGGGWYLPRLGWSEDEIRAALRK